MTVRDDEARIADGHRVHNTCRYSYSYRYNYSYTEFNDLTLLTLPLTLHAYTTLSLVYKTLRVRSGPLS